MFSAEPRMSRRRTARSRRWQERGGEDVVGEVVDPLVCVWVASPVHPDGRNACPEAVLSPPVPADEERVPRRVRPATGPGRWPPPRSPCSVPVTVSHGPSPETSTTRTLIAAICPSGATYTFCTAAWRCSGCRRSRCGCSRTRCDAGYSRQHEWMSSPTPMWTWAMAGSCVHDAMQNSQFPAVGTPEPPPTEYAGVSGTTQDCSAEVMEANVVPCP